MAHFDIKVKEFADNIKDQCEIIRNYDEVISTKANRVRVYEEVKGI